MHFLGQDGELIPFLGRPICFGYRVEFTALLCHDSQVDFDVVFGIRNLLLEKGRQRVKNARFSSPAVSVEWISMQIETELYSPINRLYRSPEITVIMAHDEIDNGAPGPAAVAVPSATTGVHFQARCPVS